MRVWRLGEWCGVGEPLGLAAGDCLGLELCSRLSRAGEWEELI